MGARLIFKAVIQVILLFGVETWVVTPSMGKALGGGSDPGGEMADGKPPVEDNGRDVEIYLGGGGKGGGRFPDDVGIRQAAPEHSRTV